MKCLVTTVCIALLALNPVLADSPPAADPALQSMIEQLGLREDSRPSRDLPGWKKPTKAVVWLDSESRLPALRAVAPGVEIVLAPNLDAAKGAIDGAQTIKGERTPSACACCETSVPS